MDILPFYLDEAIDRADTEAPTMEPGQSQKALLRSADGPGWCLFTIDVRNTYGLPFEVTFERIQEGA